MKNTLLLILAAIMMASCYKEEMPDNHALAGAGSNSGSQGSGNTGTGNTGSGNNSGTGGTGGSGSTTGSHYCGYPTKAGGRCKRLVSGSTGYCWQHK